MSKIEFNNYSGYKNMIERSNNKNYLLSLIAESTSEISKNVSEAPGKPFLEAKFIVNTNIDTLFQQYSDHFDVELPVPKGQPFLEIFNKIGEIRTQHYDAGDHSVGFLSQDPNFKVVSLRQNVLIGRKISPLIFSINFVDVEDRMPNNLYLSKKEKWNGICPRGKILTSLSAEHVQCFHNAIGGILDPKRYQGWRSLEEHD